MSSNVSSRQRLRYAFDNTMSKGTPALIGWLAVVSLLMILVFTLVIVLLLALFSPGSNPDFIGTFWGGLMRTLDAGTMGGDTGEWWYLLLMLGVTLGGIFIVSTLIGVLTAGIESKLDELRKGRSFVVEQGHTLILGWSGQVFTILSELAIANGNTKKPCVVILANKDKIEMEDAIRDKVASLGKTRVVCRTGNPIDLDDLAIANPHAARSIIVLAPEDEDPDSQVIKSILAITNSPQRRTEPYHIVAEIHDRKNLEAARLVGGDEAQIIDTGDTISRLLVQTCRQSGLSVVYNELLDFSGDEIYMHEEPGLVGKTFGEALLAYDASTVMGISSGDGKVTLNPPMSSRIAPGDRLVVITQDDDTVKLSSDGPEKVVESAIVSREPAAPAAEATLILGWNRRAVSIINELDHYVMPGSTVTAVADVPGAEAEIARKCGDLKNLTVTFRHGDTTDRATLNALNVEQYGHVIVLCYSDMMDVQRADARTLITLLHLRDMEASLGDRFSIVSEMMDDRNRQLAEVTKADDFIVSDKVLSLMLAQISENKNLSGVFTDLFDPHGSEIYLRSAADYVTTGKPLNFYTVVESARRKGEVAIGYRLVANANDSSQSYGVKVNPDKNKEVTFSAADRVIVVAEG